MSLLCLELITSTKDEEKIRKVFEEDEKRILSVLNDMEALLAENKVFSMVHWFHYIYMLEINNLQCRYRLSKNKTP